MSDAQNTVQLPLERIEDALRVLALPGEYGRVIVSLRLEPSAVHEVHLEAEYRRTTQKDVVRDKSHIVASNDRFSRVRQKLSSNCSDLRLLLPVSQLIADFRDGYLETLSVVKRESGTI